MVDIRKQLEIITHGTAQVLPLDVLEKKLARHTPLIVKLGADPTAPDLHLGHAVVLLKMRQFQDLGHHVIFLIGDFTALIGDPTGKSKTRPPLSQEEIARNTQTYFEQVSRILKPENLHIRFNKEWLGNLASTDWVKLCAKTTLARLIEREDFANRMHAEIPIGFHELLYPLMQAYDSVALKADVELGGTDQTFNLLMGRDIQEHYNQEPQVVITMPILEGTDGVQKMSKSLGNAIALNDTAENAYGKLMSLPDHLIWRYKQLLLGCQTTIIEQEKTAVEKGTLHPMELKKEMAHAIVARFWSPQQADEAQLFFETRFQKKQYDFAPTPIALPEQNPIKLTQLLQIIGAASSGTEAKRFISDGAVYVNEIKISDIQHTVTAVPGMTVRVGKHRIYIFNQ